MPHGLARRRIRHLLSQAHLHGGLRGLPLCLLLRHEALQRCAGRDGAGNHSLSLLFPLRGHHALQQRRQLPGALPPGGHDLQGGGHPRQPPEGCEDGRQRVSRRGACPPGGHHHDRRQALGHVPQGAARAAHGDPGAGEDHHQARLPARARLRPGRGEHHQPEHGHQRHGGRGRDDPGETDGVHPWPRQHPGLQRCDGSVAKQGHDLCEPGGRDRPRHRGRVPRGPQQEHGRHLPAGVGPPGPGPGAQLAPGGHVHRGLLQDPGRHPPLAHAGDVPGPPLPPAAPWLSVPCLPHPRPARWLGHRGCGGQRVQDRRLVHLAQRLHRR
mmetsp:Transcript_1773/g.5744  ORF Transcript_1773/g.5744 Transcript_1773/m.5744 type:complete len:326 (+) Transcript_1773:680-1657(+)